MLSARDFDRSCREVVVYLCERDPVLAENIMAKCKLWDMELGCVRRKMRSKQPAQKIDPLTRNQFMASLFDLVSAYDKTNSNRRKRFARMIDLLEMDQLKKNKEKFLKL